jgi:hypothetical protein
MVTPRMVTFFTGLSIVPEMLNSTFVSTSEKFSLPFGVSVPLNV